MKDYLRARAGLLLLVPIILLFICLDHGNHDALIIDSMNQLLQPKEYNHNIAHALIFIVIYEMIATMFEKTAHLSITSFLGVLLTKEPLINSYFRHGGVSPLRENLTH